MAADAGTGYEALGEALSDAEREKRSAEAIRHLSAEVGDLVAIRRRVALARSILGHAPDITPVRRALMAINGAPDTEISAAAGIKIAAANDREMAIWCDGWDAGYAAGREDKGNSSGG